MIFVCTIPVFASDPVPAHDPADAQSRRTHGPDPAVVALIKAKRGELALIEERIKNLRREQRAESEADRTAQVCERQASLEAYKLESSSRYQEERSRRFDQQWRTEMSRRRRIETGGVNRKLTHAQWLAMLQEQNPAMYELVVRKDSLQAEIGALRLRMKQ